MTRLGDARADTRVSSAHGCTDPPEKPDGEREPPEAENGTRSNPLSDHLYAALDADDPDERDYHVRAASQLFQAKLEGVGE